MSFINDINYFTLNKFAGTEILCFPSMLTYFIFYLVNTQIKVNLETFLKTLNVVVFMIFNIAVAYKRSIIYVYLSLVCFFKVSSMRYELDTQIFGALFYVMFMNSIRIQKKHNYLVYLSAYLAMLSDTSNVILVGGILLFSRLKRMFDNYLNRRSNFMDILKLFTTVLTYLVAFTALAFTDLFYFRSQFSTKVDKYDISLRNAFVKNYNKLVVFNLEDSYNKSLSSTHTYVMDRSEIDLLNIRHKHSYGNLLIEKIHETVDIGEEERFIKYGDECKLYKYKEDKKLYLNIASEKNDDDKFLHAKWLENDTDDETIVIIEKFKSEKLIDRNIDRWFLDNSPDSNSKYVKAREFFIVKHKSTNEKLCTKFDLELHWSVNARKLSYLFMIENNENHPYYLKHFKDKKCGAIRKYYLKEKYTWTDQIRTTFVYFSSIQKHKNNLLTVLGVIGLILLHLFLYLLNLRLINLKKNYSLSFIRNTTVFHLILFLFSALWNGVNVYSGYFVISSYLGMLWTVSRDRTKIKNKYD